MSSTDTRLATVHLDSGTDPYAQAIRAGRHSLTADEPESLGGANTGPAPYTLLASALAACTSITLRMYADRKGWDLGAIHVDVTIIKEADTERIERTIQLAASLTDEQRVRLAEIADKTPVTKTLARGTKIETHVVTH